MAQFIYVTGAPGAGKTTIGKAISDHYGLMYLNAESYEWEITDPPYQVKTSIYDRTNKLKFDLNRYPTWLLDGSIRYWGDGFTYLFDLVILVVTKPTIRVERLRKRERQKFGAALSPSGAMYKTHANFIEKAISYDGGGTEERSLSRDLEWYEALQCTKIIVNGELSVGHNMVQINELIENKSIATQSKDYITQPK